MVQWHNLFLCSFITRLLHHCLIDVKSTLTRNIEYIWCACGPTLSQGICPGKNKQQRESSRPQKDWNNCIGRNGHGCSVEMSAQRYMRIHI